MPTTVVVAGTSERETEAVQHAFATEHVPHLRLATT